eukprot:NODE_41_length_3073_cov_195.683862_g37_i0.p1 GENE.NODE_41_length_3073_cov_195.683862_g37_i0~~NODE_41_length_3073_cov_195.683862_g37_i0.p1  ORF type:complete len:911 (-),score=245.04 NODE_41_length_3073_cov_195.683862_g37_i0:341-2713(-)
MDYAFAIDGSGSMTDAMWRQEKEFVTSFSKHVLKSSNVQVGVCVFELRSKTITGLSNSASTIENKVTDFRHPKGWTNIGAGVSCATNILDGGRAGVAKTIIVITDGENNKGSIPGYRDAALGKGYNIFAIGVGDAFTKHGKKSITNTVGGTLQGAVGGPLEEITNDATKTYIAADFQTLLTTIDGFSTMACQSTCQIDCKASNNAGCDSAGNCRCLQGWSGYDASKKMCTVSSQPSTTAATANCACDVVAVVDATHMNSDPKWTRTSAYVQKVVEASSGTTTVILFDDKLTTLRGTAVEIRKGMDAYVRRANAKPDAVTAALKEGFDVLTASPAQCKTYVFLASAKFTNKNAAERAKQVASSGTSSGWNFVAVKNGALHVKGEPLLEALRTSSAILSLDVAGTFDLNSKCLPDTPDCAAATRPCDCYMKEKDGCGWSSTQKKCVAGSVTTCDECKDICECTGNNACSCDANEGCGWSSKKKKCLKTSITTCDECGSAPGCSGECGDCDTMFVLDASCSMTTEWPDVVQLVETISKRTSGEVGGVVYNEKATVLKEMSYDRDAFIKAVKDYDKCTFKKNKKGTESCCGSFTEVGVQAGYDLLSAHSTATCTNFILITDGHPTNPDEALKTCAKVNSDGSALGWEFYAVLTWNHPAPEIYALTGSTQSQSGMYARNIYAGKHLPLTDHCLPMPSACGKAATPCACALKAKYGCGWSTTYGACRQGHTTSCVECPTSSTWCMQRNALSVRSSVQSDSKYFGHFMAGGLALATVGAIAAVVVSKRERLAEQDSV